MPFQSFVWLLGVQVNQSFTPEISLSSVSCVCLMCSDNVNEYIVCTYVLIDILRLSLTVLAVVLLEVKCF
jgi:hypothetical protein